MRIRNILFFALLGLVMLAATTRTARAQQRDQIVTCSSDDGGRHYCSADTRGNVTLGRQRSGSPCIQGSTWGYDRRGIWVDRGCRADFVLNASGSGSDWQRRLAFPNDDNYNNDNRQGRTITCSSDDGGRHYCSADTRRGVQLANQRSGSPCVQGRTWGYDRRGIWVDRGCRADFVVR